AEIRKIRVTLARSSVIGVFIGILPGAGGDIGSWVSYNEAKRFSRTPEEFGKGSIVGISASETANNAVTGSSLIPLLTLGIPGSATAAILLGALVIHGLLPGRTLFTDHASITYTVIFGFFLANLVMGVIGMGLGRYMSYITRLSNYVLIPIIIALSVVGAYSLGNNFFDVYTMLGFGILGYFMRKIGFPPAPLILGLILGPIAETGFRQSVILAKGSVIGHILSSPISLVLFAATLLSIASAAWLEYRKLRSLRIPADAGGAEPGE
ncbi:MAG TPA: tripartite tricarboxylate transporter permease, partial [Afifellaceae bacterium]|nr:tripartite tricarboxylate transporter permease [Afifellaceae bacterium]